MKTRYGKIDMMYDGKRVPEVTATMIKFGNAGRETIRSSDIAPADPLAIKPTAGVRILSCKVTSSTRKVNRAHTEMSGTAAKVLFDFLDRNDEMTIQVLHTGKRASDVKLIGTIMGCKSGIQDASFEY